MDFQFCRDELVYGVPALDVSLRDRRCDLGPLELEKAWELTRGHGVLVGFLCGGVDIYEESLRGHFRSPLRVCGGGDVQLGTFLASVIHRVAPAARLLPIECFPGVAGEGCDVASLVAGIEAGIEAGVRVLLLPVISWLESEDVRRVCEDGKRRGVVMVAPSGSDSLSEEGFPASLGSVLSVAEWGCGGRDLGEGVNLGASTELLAPGILSSGLFGGRSVRGALVSAAVAAGVLALGLSLDTGVCVDELRRLLLGGRGVETPGFYRFFRAVPLDAARLVRVLSGRLGELVLRDLWVYPPLAGEGEDVQARVCVENVGRCRVGGSLELRSPGNDLTRVKLGVLRAGESRRLSVNLLARGIGGARWMSLEGYGALLARDSWVEFLPVGFEGAIRWSEGARYGFRVHRGDLGYGSAMIAGLREHLWGYEVLVLNTGTWTLDLECELEVNGVLCGLGSLVGLHGGCEGWIRLDMTLSVLRGDYCDVVFRLLRLEGESRLECGRHVLRRRGK
ncbi:MAG: hypothetical protein P1V97_04055 [Planctomycetota bacterium]|nr:hypothetical protein [Planctomycetota bacterium]